MSKDISNTDDMIESRDIIERIEELSSEREELADVIVACEADGHESTKAQKALEDFDTGDGLELKALQALAEKAENYCPDWTYGAQLIRHDYFEQAMDDMVADCYELPKDLPFWMTITYDYEALKQDYTEVDFDGEVYYVR
jgi:hypothetical protein